MKLRSPLWTAVAAIALATAAPPAVAVQYVLDATGVGAFGAGPYGTVTLTQDGSAVNFRVDLRSDLNLAHTANTDTTAVFSFNAIGVSAGDILSISNPSGEVSGVVRPGISEPFGTFSFGLVCVSGEGCRSRGGYEDPLTFTVADSVMTDFAFQSSGGAYFAAGVIQFTTATEGDIGSTAVLTPIPEPETYALMLAGLGMMGLMVKRHRR